MPGLTISPDGSRLFVSAMVRDEVLVIDTAATKVVGEAKVGRAPVGLALSPDGQRLVVASMNSNSVSVVDTGALRRVATVRVGTAPNYLAPSPNGQRLYVTNTGSTISGVGAASVSVVDTAALKVVDTAPLAAYPDDIVISPDGRSVYVTHASVRASQVDVLDADSGRVIASIDDLPDSGDFLTGLAVSPDSERVYAGSLDTVDVIDAPSRQAVTTIDVDEGPNNMVVSADGKRLYVANQFSRTVSVIDTDSLQVIATVLMGGYVASQ